jgi:hypothetical protein
MTLFLQMCHCEGMKIFEKNFHPRSKLLFTLTDKEEIATSLRSSQ